MITGLLGGVFDPIHNDHLKLAIEAKQEYKLDLVYFVPASIPAHKPKAFFSVKDRLNMLKLALSDYCFFKISEVELKRTGVSYMIDTLNELQVNYLILGKDAYDAIDTWHQAEAIKKKVELITYDRFSNVSSSLIKERLLKNQPIKGLLPEKVEQYILNLPHSYT